MVFASMQALSHVAHVHFRNIQVKAYHKQGSGEGKEGRRGATRFHPHLSLADRRYYDSSMAEFATCLTTCFVYIKDVLS